MSLMLFLVKILVGIFIIRFHANAYRLGHNPLLAKLNQLSDPLVRPFSRLLPHPRWDMGALIVAMLLAILTTTILFGSLRLGLILGIAHSFLATWLDIIMYSLIIVVIGSWLQTDPRQPVMQLMLCCNEWLMAPLRRHIPAFGGLDFTPILALLGVQMAKLMLSKLTSSLLIGAAQAALS